MKSSFSAGNVSLGSQRLLPWLRFPGKRLSESLGKTNLTVLFFYLSLFLLPLLPRFSLYHDDFSVSASLFDPPTQPISLAIWCVLLAALIPGQRAARLDPAIALRED